MSAARHEIPELRWRAAGEGDLPWLVSQRNDPATVAFSRRGELSVEQMRRDLFSQSSRRALIAEKHGEALGYVVLDRRGEEAELSIVVAPEFRGRGFGVALIESATLGCLGDGEVRRLRAFIDPRNAASVRAFEAAGYVDSSELSAPAESLLDYVYSA